MIKHILATLLVASTLACGGQLDDGDAQDLKAPASFEPFGAYAVAKQHAAKYCTNPRAIGLGGELASDKVSYQWTWRFRCDGQVFAIVAVGPSGARVTSHGLRTWMLGCSTFDPATVAVRATDALKLVSKDGYGHPTELDLGEVLAPNAVPRWSVTTPTRSFQVNAITGSIGG
jgi:hypothetical protein